MPTKKERPIEIFWDGDRNSVVSRYPGEEYYRLATEELHKDSKVAPQLSGKAVERYPDLVEDTGN